MSVWVFVCSGAVCRWVRTERCDTLRVHDRCVCGGGGVVSTPVESDGFFCVCVLGVRTHGGKACGGRRSCPSALGRHKARPTISGRTRLPAAGPGAEFAGLTSPRSGTAVEQTTTFGGEGRHTGRRRAGLRGCGVRVVPVGAPGAGQGGREGDGARTLPHDAKGWRMCVRQLDACAYLRQSAGRSGTFGECVEAVASAV